MSFAVKKPCRAPGCSALIPAGQGSWCAAHARAPRQESRQADRARGTAAERGYDHRWQQARAAFLARYPLCPGVLVPTAHWTPERAQTFHAEREAAREAGALLPFSIENQESKIKNWLAQHPIYRIEPWDIARPAVAVDHIVPHRGDPELLWAEWNWQPLTKRAHDRKTARYDRAP